MATTKFRTRAKLHFLTYPQCPCPKEEAHRQLQEKAGNKYGWCTVSEEDHEARENDTSAGVHLHVMQEYSKNFDTSDPRYWDIVYEGVTYHPHFEPVKNKAKCLQYVIKDGNYMVHGTYKDAPFNIDVYLDANGKKQGYGFTFLATEIKKGKTLKEIDELCPGHVLNHKRKLVEYMELQEQFKRQAIVRPTFHGFNSVEDFYWSLVVNWANVNFLQLRERRQRQLWLWSRQPELGKSFPWCITMRAYKTCYEWLYGPKQSKEILECDYILIDELKGGITVTELKSLSQMYGMMLDIKYGEPRFFNKNVPLIITSNRPPREIYHKCTNEDMESLESRFEIIEVNTRCHLIPKALPDPPEPEPLPQPEPDVVPPEDVQEEDLLRFKEDISEELDHDSDKENRDPNDHSEFSEEEYTKMKWFQKHKKDLKKN